MTWAFARIAYRAPKGPFMTRAERPAFRPLLLLLIFVVAVLAAYLYMCNNMADPDQFWHIATGRWIVENRAIPKVDIFSWWATANHRPWIPQGWLFGVSIYGVWALGGFTAVYWFAALLEGALVMLVYALTRARGVNPVWSMLVALACLLGTLTFVVPRPQMMTFVLIPLTALLLQKGKWFWALVVVVIGVNMHGGIWPLYVLVFALYEFPKRWWLVALALAATMANPAPLGTLWYPFRSILNPKTSQINEFQPTALWERKGDFVMYFALYFAMRNRKVPIRDGLFALAFIVLSFTALRHIEWFYILVLPVLAPYFAVTTLDLSSVTLPAWASRIAPARLRRLFAGGDTETGPGPDEGGEEVVTLASESVEGAPAQTVLTRRPSRVIEIALVGALLFTILFLGVRATKTKVDVDKYYPETLASYLKVNGVKRLFNVWHEGGYLIFKGIPVLIDGRGDPYTAEKKGDRDLSSEYLDASQLATNPLPFIKGLGCDYALVPSGSLMWILNSSPDWVVVKTDTYHALFKYEPQDASGSREQTATTPPMLPLFDRINAAANAAANAAGNAPTP
jgi:hypothetical protein